MNSRATSAIHNLGAFGFSVVSRIM